MSAPYQVMPPLSSVVLSALRTSVETFGIQVPIVVDENGAIIDGHHRAKLAAELGIECPREVRKGLSEEQKMTLARRLNADRRHLTEEERRAVLAGRIIAAPERSDRQIAADLNVTHPTVAKVRSELESTGRVLPVEKRIGADGKTRALPATKPTKRTAPPPIVARAMPPEAARDPLRVFYASFETHRKELEGVFESELDKLGRYARDPYVVSNVKRVVDRIRKALDTFRAGVGGPS
ncbi:ParB N-terminal domain-containing protein [Paraburkholderia metrosideri]|uniref:ParB/Sulfiredoxin domain-containing protein n=1 Tax=Paraburkholderia metrosideri TaxID=580937 RepID=A0ABM8P1Q1_9BURK|nr:ParB N-terminal domain-containing protein [Paraburkholderia metrosideri]CAD6553487.1 hypothetical protein LMG28140_05301 [Paraburkholderia metrosideri]